MDEEIGKILAELVEFVRNATPVIWEAAYRQVYVIAIYQAITSLVCFAIAWLVISHGSKLWNDKPEKQAYHYDAYVAWSYIIRGVAMIFVILAIIFGSSVIGPLVNPEYYALRQLLLIVK